MHRLQMSQVCRVDYRTMMIDSCLNSIANLFHLAGMTIGNYLFELSVTDESKNNASDKVQVTVVQGKTICIKLLSDPFTSRFFFYFAEKNTPPVANAGGDQSIILPVSAIYLNGTKSSDDLGIVRYTWTRDGSSLAVGNIVGNTSAEAVLVVS